MKNNHRILQLLINGYRAFIFLGMIGLLYFTQNPIYLIVAAFLLREMCSIYMKKDKNS